MALQYSLSLVLGAAAPARAVAHNSYLRLSGCGSCAVKRSMEAGYGGRFSFWNSAVNALAGCR
jgi:hypothetical protein